MKLICNRLSFVAIGLVASMAVGGAASAADAPAIEWKVSDGGNGHWYGIRMRSIPDMTWMQMRDAAVEDGGHLVTISNAAGARRYAAMASG